MSKTLQLSIPEPCHEDWNQMTPTDKGRFCASCQKDVVDFTNMNNAQLIKFFRKKASSNVCGRFYNDQLNTEIPIPTKRIPWAKYFFQITLPAFIASGKLMAQGAPKMLLKENKDVIVVIAGGVKKKEQKKAPLQTTTVKGQVTDEQGNGIAYATIINNKNKAGISADSLGNFTLQDVHLTEGSEYTISAVGFSPAIVFASRINNNTPLQVQLMANNTLNEVVVKPSRGYGCDRRTVIAGGAMSVISKTIYTSNVLPDLVEKQAETFTVFPNPVKRNTNITVSLNTTNKGKYRYNILSIDGKTMATGIKEFTEGKNMMTVLIDQRFSAGNYIIQLQHEKGKQQHSTKFIVQ